MRFHDVVFAPDFLEATHDDGEVVRLSRRERALVAALTAQPHRLMTRAQLLDVMAGDDPEVSDRKVDVVVTRLRQKLRDPARSPRFIATQYGEGYVWIAEPQAIAGQTGLLVIGPVGGASAAEENLPQALGQAIAAIVAPGQTVSVRRDWRPGVEGRAFRFSLEMTLVAEGAERAAVLVLRDERLRTVIESRRVGPTPDAAALATLVVATMWRRLARAADAEADPAQPPLVIGMQDAALLLGPAEDPWAVNELRLKSARAEDPAATLMEASGLHARRVLALVPDGTDAEAWMRSDAEIRSLVEACLSDIEDEPILALEAARLLAQSTGDLDRAESLARRALEGSAAFGAALPVLGQIRGWRGDIEGAVARLDQARALASPGSEFEVYLLVVRGQMLRAAGDFAAAKALDAELFRIKQAAEGQLGLLTLLPGEAGLSDSNRRRLAAVDEGAARFLLNHQFHVAARHFLQPEHRRNAMAGLTEHLVRRFGPGVVPEAVAHALSA